MKHNHNTDPRGKTPNRIHVPANYSHLRGVLPAVDADMATGARTAEAAFLRRVREHGAWPHRTAWAWESAKRRCLALTGGIQSHLLCGHEV